MKKEKSILKRLQSLSKAMSRYPLTVVLLFLAVVLNAIEINNNNDEFLRVVFALIAGALFGVVFQVLYERFFTKEYVRYLFMGVAILLTGGFYLIIRNTPDNNLEMSVRTIVTLFALLISFIWIPTIKNEINFNQSFMATFKSFFIALLFSSTVFLGTSLIYLAIDQLLFSIDDEIFTHTANVVYLMFAPLYFFSLIPAFTERKNEDNMLLKKDMRDENIRTAISCPKYMDILISYIIVPITGIFTIILMIYIVGNIRGDFWNNNLLEPMLVSYSITVMIVYILASELTNRFAVIFRKVFPKLLVPIVLFQTISSILKIGEMGVTHGRYYVIMYGIFAFISGIGFTFLPVRKNGFIAGILILFSVISMIPPIDAFSVSRTSQLSMLETVLVENNMLQNNHIKPNKDLLTKEQNKVSKIVSYLSAMDYADEIDWLEDYTKEYDFLTTFGFNQYVNNDSEASFFYGELDMDTVIDIRRYHYFTIINLWQAEGSKEVTTKENIIIGDQEYLLVSNMDGEERELRLEKNSGEEVIQLNLNDIISRFAGTSTEKGMLSKEKATFTVENEKAELTMVIQHVNFSTSSLENSFGLNGYVFIKIK